MKSFKLQYIYLAILFAFTANSQLWASSPKKDSLATFNVTLGVGVGYYFKDLPTVPDNNIHNIQPVISAKFYWQPPFRIQLGLETGYYPLYSTTAIQFEGEPPIDCRASTSVLPIMVNVNMRIWKQLRVAVAAGPSFIFSQIEIENDFIKTNQFSAENYMLSLSYLHPLTNHISLGGELSYFYVGKIMDTQMSLKVSAAYKF